jgi:flagellar motor switch protein FliG
MRFLSRFLFLTIFILSQYVFSAGKSGSSGSAEILSAKSFLEDILVKRYTQGLATIVDKQAFVISAQLDVVEMPATDKKNDPIKNFKVSETPFDLTVGSLDSEQIIQQYASPEEQKAAVVSFLTTKKIKGVFVSVGVREDLGEDMKKNIEAWIKTRVEKEFGSIAKYEVAFLKDIPDRPSREVHKNWIDWLNQFQALAAVTLAALTFFLAVLFWRFTTSKLSTSNTSSGEKAPITLKTEGFLGATAGGGIGGSGSSMTTLSDDDVKKTTEDAFILSQKINALTPRISDEINNLSRIWSLAGEEGQFKLVCYADAIGKELGRLPIPPEVINDIAKIFGRMSQVSIKEKKEALEKVYWDLMTTLNLGSSALEQPFSYLNNLETGEDVNHILMDQNPKLKTLVSLYLPKDVRRKYIKGLTDEQKLELLETATQLNQISTGELKKYETVVRGRMAPDTQEDTVQLDMTFDKIVSSLGLLEQFDLLPKMKSTELQDYKRRIPTVAFLNEWPEDKLGLILSRLSADQILLYLRLNSDMKDRFLKLSPPMVAEVLEDDLLRTDTSSSADKEAALKQIESVMISICKNKEVDLTEIFAKSINPEASNVVNFKTA